MTVQGTSSKRGSSQLAQLKRSLNCSGLSRTAKVNRDKKLKSSVSNQLKDPDFKQKKLEEIRASQNLFDIKTSKLKFPSAQAQSASSKPSKNKNSQIVSSNLTRTVGRPTQSASKAHQRRLETLLPEYQNRHRSSNFLDKRFGEGNPSLTPEEKALERFTKERQSKLSGGKRRRVFNLEDEGEGLYDDDHGEFGGEFQLTHHGQNLDFEEEEDGQRVNSSETRLKDHKDRSMERENNSLLDDGQDFQGKKSKAQVMSELINKSKAHKYERQMVKDKDDELRLGLDNELKNIRSLLVIAGSTQRSGSNSKQSIDHSNKETYSHNSEASPKRKESIWPDKTQNSKDESRSEDDPRDISSQKSPSKDQLDNTPAVTESMTSKLVSDLNNSSTIDQKLLQSLIGSSSRSSSAEAEDAEEKEDDDYDRFVRELAFEARAKPSDRLKTTEETALEEAERLRVLEEKRQRRMTRVDDDDDDDDDEEEESSIRRGKRKRRKPEADDLDVGLDFTMGNERDQKYVGGGALRPDGAFGALANESEEDSDSSASSFRFTGGSEGEISGDGSSDQDQDDRHSGAKSLLSFQPNESSQTKKSKITGELAYTYPCPSSHSEFLSILRSGSVKSIDLPTVVQRIRVLHHPSLGKDNKTKLATFNNVLIDHLIYLSSGTQPKDISFSVILSGLLPHLTSLCQTHTQTAASHFISKINLMHKNLVYALSNNETTKAWPGLSELVILRVIGLIWSTSDFSHPVVAPALILICQYLNQLRVRDFKHLISGLYMCSLVVQYEAHSRRLVPEAINFLLLAVLRMSFPKPESFTGNVSWLLPIPEGNEIKTFTPRDRSLSINLEPKPLDLGVLLSSSEEPSEKSEEFVEPSDQDLVDLLDVTISTLDNLFKLYSSSSSTYHLEIISQANLILKYVEGAKICTLSKVCRLRLIKLIESLEKSIETLNRMRILNPLKLQDHRPIPIKPQEPKFEVDFNPNKKSTAGEDPSIVEINKLKGLIKKEKKGAIRELRKDNRFLAAEKSKEIERADLEYKNKISRIVAGLQVERSEEKKIDRIKSRLKKIDKARSSKK